MKPVKGSPVDDDDEEDEEEEGAGIGAMAAAVNKERGEQYEKEERKRKKKRRGLFRKKPKFKGDGKCTDINKRQMKMKREERKRGGRRSFFACGRAVAYSQACSLYCARSLF